MSTHLKNPFAALLDVSRFHIVLIAAGGSLVFGRLLTGSFHPDLALLVAVDWFLVNIVNRVVDRREDADNAIPAANFAFEHQRGILALATFLYVASFAIHLVWRPVLAPVRLVSHLLAFAYNFRLLPVGDGRRVRLKEMYFAKNCASCAGFLLTLFAYPLVALSLRPEVGFFYVLVLIVFFATLEMSFEVIYDLRDEPGDRAAGVASFPVAHGAAWSARLIFLLNLASIYAILAGAAFGLFEWKETILGVAPVLQIWLFRRGLRRGFMPRDIVVLTWTFAAMNFGYVAWVALSLPLGFPLHVTLPVIIEIALIIISVLGWIWLAPLYGPRRYLACVAALVLGSWVAEASAIWFYHYYSYSRAWHFFIGPVPVAIVLIWPMVILTTHHLIRRIGLTSFRAVLAGAAMVAFEAILAEVVCVHAGLWAWEGRGIFGVPVIGVLGWGAFALGALAAVEFLDGRKIAWLPVVGFLSTHAFLQILWRAGFRSISHTAIPAPILIAAMALLAIVLTRLAAKWRGRLAIAMLEIAPRLAAAQLMFYILFASRPDAATLIFCLLFVPPYVTLAKYEWAMPGERGPVSLGPLPRLSA